MEIIEELVNWMEASHGPIKSLLEVKEMGVKGRGMVAGLDLQDNDMIIEIPEFFMLSNATVERSEIAKVLNAEAAANDTFHDPHTRLVFLLMFEISNPNSFWVPYFKTLPKSYDLPVTWGPDAMEIIKGTSLYDEIVDLRSKIDSSYEELVLPTIHKYPHILSEKIHTLQAYEWALYTIYSRQYTYEGEDGCLVPLADMINHNSELEGTNSNYYFDKDSKTFKLFVHQTYTKEEEVFISYGKKTNEQLMQCYGFFNQKATEYRFIVPPTWNFENKIRKMQILAQCNTDITGFTLHPYETPDALLSVLRILVATEEELDSVIFDKEGNYQKAISNEMIGFANEKRVYQIIDDMCQDHLDHFPTTAEEDMLLAQDLEWSPKKQAYEYRSEEKRFLKGVQQTFRQAIEELQMNGLPENRTATVVLDY